MRHAVHYEPSGRIVSANGVIFDHEAVPRQGCKVLLLDTRIDINSHYIKEGTATPIPEKPEGRYVFDYGTEAWVLDEQAAENDVRTQRNALLAKSDWTQLDDAPGATKQAWREYRRALRDITSQPGFPHDVEWPEPPT
jgi:hypothetical protein